MATIKLPIGNYFNVPPQDVVATYTPDGVCILLATFVPALRIFTDATDWVSRDRLTRTKVDLAWSEESQAIQRRQ